MSESSTPQDTEGGLVYLFGLLAGGLILGFGLRSLYWSFGWREGECLSCDFASIGFTATDNLSLLPAADYSIGMVVAGVLVLVYLNANAWKRTGGY